MPATEQDCAEGVTGRLLKNATQCGSELVQSPTFGLGFGSLISNLIQGLTRVVECSSGKLKGVQRVGYRSYEL